MNLFTRFIIYALVSLPALGAISAQELINVSFGVVEGSGAKYIIAQKNGGLGLSKDDTSFYFKVDDLNGGKLESGDKIRIIFEKTAWGLNGEVVSRFSLRGADDVNLTFELKEKDGSYLLIAPGGNWLSSPNPTNRAFTLSSTETEAMPVTLTIKTDEEVKTETGN
jgi:hypothetical protein